MLRGEASPSAHVYDYDFESAVISFGVHTFWRRLVAGVFDEVVLDARAARADLLLELVHLVQEEDHGDGAQPAVGPDAREQIERLAQPVLRGVLAQRHVVRGGGRDEDDGSHVVEALDPLAPLIALPAHIEHAAQ